MSNVGASLRILFRGSVALGALTIAMGTAIAQQAPPPAPSTTEAEPSGDVVVITGSRLARTPETAPTPVIQVEGTEINESGQPNLIDYLQDVPALNNSFSYEDATNLVGVGGLSLLDLRNLGTARTLVLVDGRRHVGGDTGTASVDVDTIPSTLIDRVEIVTGGASATYGADAVSGVVNFIMKDDYEGLEFDANIAQLAEKQNLFNSRASVTWGKNFLDDRLNVYAFAEYQTADAVFDKDLDVNFVRNNARVIVTDVDPASAPNDGVFDNSAVFNLRTLNRPRGGILTVANGLQPSPAADPDIPFANCTAANAGAAQAFNIAGQQANCFTTNPGASYQFRNDGSFYLADFGAGRNVGVTNRITTIGGSGDTLFAVQTNRIPEQEAARFQIGGNFDLTDSVNVFAELKYVDEDNLNVFQPHFTNIGIRQLEASPAEYWPIDTIQNYTIGLDNAYLDPALRSIILGNQRTIYNAAGQVTGTVADPRAQFRLFSYDLGYRPEVANRYTARAVIGARGSIDQLAFIQNLKWEASYTYGEMNARLSEPQTIDVDRYAYSVDAVVDTLGEVGPAGQIVCRVRIMADRGIPVINSATETARAANDPAITQCQPSRVFGIGGFSQAAQDYILFDVVRKEMNEQEDALAFVSGELGDYWGAGPIGAVFGVEGRKETAHSLENVPADRFLFGNSLGNMEDIGFDIMEFFAEVDIPIIQDKFLIRSLNISGAARTSNYSSIGVTETWSSALRWEINNDITLRATKGLAIRAPNIDELYSPPGDTFPVLVDNCSRPVIDATADAAIRANRIQNCAALGIPAGYNDPNPTASNTGKSGSNPNLEAEESDSWTLSAIFTPSFVPGFTFIADYYDIRIDNAIETVDAQTLLNLCTDQATLNVQACSSFTRAGASAGNAFEIIDFLEGPFNFAGLVTKGIDFEARYGFETADLFRSDFGRIDFAIAGNYLIRTQYFTNPDDPDDPINIDTTPEDPRVRLTATTTWTGGPLSIAWKLDFQESQEIINDALLGANTDNRESALWETGDFYQNDVTFSYQIADGIRLRGGVLNVFDAEPDVQTSIPQLTTDDAGFLDSYDLFGRRFFAGINVRF